MGNHFDSEITRAIIATRLSSLVSGVSGISFELLERIEFLLKNDILPRIPEEGSVGASGDLTPLSYIARALIGEEEVLYKNKIQNAGDVYKELGVKPYVLKPKETLAIINGTSVMTAIATIAYIRSEYLGKLCCRLTAMAIQALKGNFDHFDKDLFSVKPHPGQMQVAEFIRKDLKITTKNTTRLQDRYSIRCAPHIIGVLMDTLPFLKKIIEIELNSASDNPIVIPKKKKILHGGHFYGGHIAFAMDSLKTLVANLADMIDRQLALLVDQKYNNGLPENLKDNQSSKSVIQHGFKAIQISVSAWTAEALKLTMPASVFSRSTECHNQDKVSMGTIAARDCLRVLQLTEQTAAAHLLAVTQALHLRFQANQLSKSNISASLRKMYNNITKEFKPLTEDSPQEKMLRKFTGFIQNQKWNLFDEK